MRNTKNTWGGKRSGSGRKAHPQIAPHDSRPSLARKTPFHVRLKLRNSAPSLKTLERLEVFKKASLRARRFGLRILHFSVRPHHIEMICEAKNAQELESSFKSLNTTLAIALKKALEAETHTPHQGPLFLGRYWMRILSNSAQLKHTLRTFFVESRANRYSSASLLGSYGWMKLQSLEDPPSLLRKINRLKDYYLFRSGALFKETALKITALPQFPLSKTLWLSSS